MIAGKQISAHFSMDIILFEPTLTFISKKINPATIITDKRHLFCTNAVYLA